MYVSIARQFTVSRFIPSSVMNRRPGYLYAKTYMQKENFSFVVTFLHQKGALHNQISVLYIFINRQTIHRFGVIPSSVMNRRPGCLLVETYRQKNFPLPLIDPEPEVTDLIFHSRKSVLCDYQSTWTKNNGELFEVTMCSYDVAEVCELLRLFLLKELNTLFTEMERTIGLYRDDVLAVVQNTSGPAIDRLKKDIIKIFQNHKLWITTETNLIQTDFLDVTLNLISGKYWPFCKPGDQPLHINARLNHHPNIIWKIPKMIASQLSKNSCSEEEFKKAGPTYEKALRETRK